MQPLRANQNQAIQSLAEASLSRRSLIVGLGKTGLSVARFLVARNVDFAVLDSRENPPGLDELRKLAPHVAVFLGGFDADAFAHAQQIIVSPGVSLATPAIAKAIDAGIPVLGDIELFALFVDAPVVAITGSNGKSTVTTLLAEMIQSAGLQVRAGGNLGTPALDLMVDNLAGAAPDFYVLELSSFQLETTHHLQPACAVVLNLSADHLDRYPSYEAYVEAKARIYQNALVAVVNRDDRPAMELARYAKTDDQATLSFGCDMAEGDDFGLCKMDGEPFICQGNQHLMAVSKLRLPGAHNLVNALAAMALGEAIGLPLSARINSIENFSGLAHRTQWVAELQGVNWYNDSKGTNVGATIAAITGIAEPVVLIAGGQGKGADFSELGDAIAQDVKLLVLIGEDAAQIEAAVAGRVPTQVCETLDLAVHTAQQLAMSGDVVLFSPACASFDMFEGFEHRGQSFVTAVQSLMNDENNELGVSE